VPSLQETNKAIVRKFNKEFIEAEFFPFMRIGVTNFSIIAGMRKCQIPKVRTYSSRKCSRPHFPMSKYHS